MAVDLHIHTAASGDGEYSPKEILQLAKANQLQAIAITDHDTVNSVEEAIYWGENCGIEVIPGCEFTAAYEGRWLHVLGYFINYNHFAIRQWCDEIKKSRLENVDLQIAKLREAGFYLDKDKVIENGSIPMPICYSKAIFADKRNNNNKLLQQYRSQENYMLKFCLDWIVTGRPYNAPQYIPDVKIVIGLITQYGGVPVLAHPAATLSINDDLLLDSLIEMGLKGVEAFTTWHTQEQEAHYYQFCLKRGIIFTCGSDFHGKSKPHIQIGQVNNNNYRIVEFLKNLVND